MERVTVRCTYLRACNITKTLALTISLLLHNRADYLQCNKQYASNYGVSIQFTISVSITDYSDQFFATFCKFVRFKPFLKIINSD